jgi:hypothetical protein
MTLRGRIKNGGVVFDEPPPLPEGTEVLVQAVGEPAGTGDRAAQASTPTLYERYKGFIGAAEGLPEDFADEHDHYIHGTPKRDDR